MILSHELAHIALGHKIDTKLAFTDRFFFPDPDTFQRMNFERSLLDEQAADAKALELLNNSPYKDKLATAGLFLKQVQERASVLPNLIRPHLGNPLGSKTAVRLAPVAEAAPQLEKTVDQIAALSLGARINLDPWSNRIEMMSPKHVALLSPAEKMPLEVTPFFPYLTRLPNESLAGHAEQATAQHCHSGSCRTMQNEQSNKCEITSCSSSLIWRLDPRNGVRKSGSSTIYNDSNCWIGKAPLWNLAGPTTALPRRKGTVTVKTQIVCTNQDVAAAVDNTDSTNAGGCVSGGYIVRLTPHSPAVRVPPSTTCNSHSPTASAANASGFLLTALSNARTDTRSNTVLRLARVR